VRSIRLLIEYEGTRYHGWQVQPNGLTVQEVVEKAIARITGQSVRLLAAGRTDAGVHALGQVAGFRLKGEIDLDRLHRGINALTPRDVSILAAEEAPARFSAKSWAKSKRYTYLILNRPEPPAVLRRFCWHVKHPLALGPMRKATERLVGTHDFSAFRSSDCSSTRPVQDMIRAGIRSNRGGMIALDFEATGFLKHMVRAIVGTLVEVGLGKRAPEDLGAVLESRDRGSAGPTAPPQGLFLVSVRYEDGFGEQIARQRSSLRGILPLI